MAIHLSPDNAAARKNAPEIIPTPLHLKPDETKVQNKKTVKPVEPSSPLGSPFLTKPESQQVLKRFEPLQPVLRKALEGTQVLRREFQEIERLTQTGSAALVPPKTSVLLGREGGSVVPPKESIVPTPPAVTETSPHPKSTAAVSSALETHAEKAGEGRSLSTNRSVVRIPENENAARVLRQEPPASEAVIRPPVKGEGVFLAPPPQETSKATVTRPSQPLVDLGKGTRPISEDQPVVGARVVKPVSGFSPKVNQEQRGPKAIVPGAVFSNVNRPLEEKPPVGALAGLTPAPRHLNEGRNLAAEAVAQAIIFPKVLAPQTTVEITKSNETSTTVSFQSQVEAPRTVVQLTGTPLPSPKRLDEQNRLSFDRRLREGGIQNFVAEAKQTVLFHEVPPLPPRILAAEGHLALPVLTAPPVQAFKPETVARNPLHGDNGPQVPKVSEAKESQVAPVSLPVAKTVPRTGENPAPPLSNFDRLRNRLPTNVKSRLLPVPSVNLLDLVL